MNKFPVVILIVGLTCCLGSPSSQAESLYDESRFKSLVSDARAHGVGDALTLLIIETSSAKSASEDAASKSVGLTGRLGKQSETQRGSLDAGVERASDGSTSREGRLRASLTVSVTAIDDAGKLKVEGSQSIILNGEKQLILVEGWVRPEDIDGRNVVLSPRLVDAKIEYTGAETDGEDHNPGFFHRMLSAIGII